MSKEQHPTNAIKLFSNIFFSDYHLKPASHTVFTSFRKINRRCNFTWQGVTESLLTSQNQYETPLKPLLKKIIRKFFLD